MRCAFAAFLIAAAAHADSVVYVFIGIDSTGPFAEPEAFQLTVLDFIDPQADGEGLDFTCNQLDSITNCGSPGVIFSDQNGAFSAQLQFDAPIVGSIFTFAFGAFTTPGIYAGEAGTNSGTLTVRSGGRTKILLDTSSDNLRANANSGRRGRKAHRRLS